MELLRDLRVGFIGAGRMAGAVAQAVLRAGKTGSTIPRYHGGRSKQVSLEGRPSQTFQRPLRSQMQQARTHSSRPAASVDHLPGHLRLFQSQNQPGSPNTVDQENISHPGNTGTASPSHTWPSFSKPEHWRTNGEVQPDNILASAPSNRNLGKFQDMNCKTTHSNLEVVENSTLIFLGTKPNILPIVLKEIAPAVTSHHVVVSMAAGVKLQTLEEVLPAGTKVLRIMPNLPCMVLAGAIIVARGSSAGEQEASLLKTLLSPCGLCEEGPESYIDIHGGLSGSGVAYVYMFAEALADGAVKMGMQGTTANKIAAQTLLGAAKMILETGEHPAALRNAVCTPGGTTIHALHELEKGSFRATVMNAVEAATRRSQEMGKQ